MSTLVITFVGGVGILGIYALAVSTATSIKLTGLATSTALAASSAIDLDRTAQNPDGAPYINRVAAKALAEQTFATGRDANNLSGNAELVSVNVYNITSGPTVAAGADPPCNTGIAAMNNVNFNVIATTAGDPTTSCWLSVSFRTSPSRTPPIGIDQNGKVRWCPADGPSYGPTSGYPGYFLTCAMHFTSGVATTIRYRVQPCNGGSLPFCSDTYAYASGYADYTYTDG